MHRVMHACVIAGLLLNHNPLVASEQCERADQDRPRVGPVLVGHRYRLSKNPSAPIPGYFGLTAEYGGVAGRGSEVLDNAIWNGSIYLGYDTPVGPMYFGDAPFDTFEAMQLSRVRTVKKTLMQNTAHQGLVGARTAGRDGVAARPHTPRPA